MHLSKSTVAFQKDNWLVLAS